MSNYFEELSKVDCSKHVEKKGRFSYLSWPFAVSELRKRHPSATWSVVKSQDGLPYVSTESGCFVEVAVTVDDVTLSQIHPVLDNNNKTIPAPNAFQINTSIQRCLVKAIALHGLGLYIYAGEDLPDSEQAPTSTVTEKQAADIIALVTELGADKAAMLAWVSDKAGEDISTVSAIPAEAYDSIMKMLERKRAP